MAVSRTHDLGALSVIQVRVSWERPDLASPQSSRTEELGHDHQQRSRSRRRPDEASHVIHADQRSISAPHVKEPGSMARSFNVD